MTYSDSVDGFATVQFGKPVESGRSTLVNGGDRQDETMASTSLDHAISARTHPSILANLHPEVRDRSAVVLLC